MELHLRWRDQEVNGELTGKHKCRLPLQLTIMSQSAQFVCASAGGKKKAMQETEGGKIKATAHG